jgi:hypothetical protein
LEDFGSSPLGYLQILLYFPFVLDFRTFLSVDYIYSVYPCLVETLRGSILLLWSFHTLFSFVPLRQKWGVYVSFWTGPCILTGQVIFVPEWLKGEFVSL